MAEEDLTTQEGGKKKSKLMLIIIIAVVVLGGGGAGAYFFMFSGESTGQASSAAAGSTEDAMVSDTGKAIYVAMPRPFQFNAPGVSRERLVQIEVQLMVRGPANEERAKRHIPMIEGTLLRVFSTSNADELVTDSGKADLRARSTSQIRQIMNELEENPVIEQVLFTGFVIQ